MPDWFPSFVDKMVTKNIGQKIDADVMLFKDKIYQVLKFISTMMVELMLLEKMNIMQIMK